jgi:polyisoprenoid-binding protein YceI
MTLRRAALGALLALAWPLMAWAASQNVADMPGGHYVIDKKHASVIAKVLHMGVSRYTVRFDSFDASFDYDPAHPTAAHVEASVDPASLDVNADYSSKFAEDFLSASKFPKMTFSSTSIQTGTDNTGAMTGNLTFLGVTKPVTFDVTFVGTGRGLLPPFSPTAGFSAVTKIKRSDFGSTYLNNLVGDEVTIEIEGEFDRR